MSLFLDGGVCLSFGHNDTAYDNPYNFLQNLFYKFLKLYIYI